MPDDQQLNDATLASILTRIEVKLDAVIRDHDDHEVRIRALEATAPSSADHETRLRAIEKKIWLWSGAAAGLGGVVGSLSGMFI